MTDTERYWYYKQNGLCVKCGQPNDTKNAVCSKCSAKAKKRYKDKKEFCFCQRCETLVEEGHVYCKSCLDERKREYDWKKQHGICVRCGSNPSAPGKLKCAECSLKKSVEGKKYEANRTEEEKQKIKEEQSERYQKRVAVRKENGLCIKCGKKAMSGKLYCIDCLLKRRKESRQYRENHNLVKNHELLGECRWCSNKPLPNKCYCEKHYKEICKILEEARNSPAGTVAREKLKKEKINMFWSEMSYYGKKKSS